jgi:hypothetical protein
MEPERFFRITAMTAPVATLTKKFNEATVKKGDIFQVELVEGGMPAVMWTTQVVSGKATLLDETSKQLQPSWEGKSLHHRVYRAEEAGEIQIVASSREQNIAFKVHVN